MKQQMNHKIRNQQGETIGEMLVSSLIIALAIVMLITMVNISAKLVQKSVDNRKNFFTNINDEEMNSNKPSSENSQLEMDSDDASPSLHIKDSVSTQVNKLSGNRYAVTYKKASQ